MKNKFLILVSLFTFSFLITGCPELKSSPDRSEEGGVGSVDGEGYRLALIHLIVGNYTGDCKSQPDGKSATGTIAVEPSGNVTTPGVTGNLLKDEVNLQFVRKFSGDIVESATFSAADTSSDKGFNLSLESGTTDESNYVRARQGIVNAPGITCTRSTQSPSLKTKDIYLAISSFLSSSKQQLVCNQSGRVKLVDFEIREHQAYLDNEVYPLYDTLTEQSAVVFASSNDLVYSIKMVDNRMLTIAQNENGSLTAVTFNDHNGNPYECAVR